MRPVTPTRDHPRFLATIQTAHGCQTAEVRFVVARQGERWATHKYLYPDLAAAMTDLAANTLAGSMASTLSLEYAPTEADQIVKYYAVTRAHDEVYTEWNNVESSETLRRSNETGMPNIGILWAPGR